jgi:hypothetical protein
VQWRKKRVLQMAHDERESLAGGVQENGVHENGAQKKGGLTEVRPRGFVEVEQETEFVGKYKLLSAESVPKSSSSSSNRKSQWKNFNKYVLGISFLASLNSILLGYGELT